MSRNMVKSQKGSATPASEEMYGGGEQCHAAVVQSRWPAGFECPDCGSCGHCCESWCAALVEDGKPDQINLRPVKAFSLVAIRKLAATAQSRPVQAREPPKRPPSSGSTRRWATSRRLWLEPIEPYVPSMFRVISRSSNIGSTADMISAP